MSQFTSSFTCQPILVIIATLDPSLLHSFTPGSKPIFSTNPFYLNFSSYSLDCLHDNGTGLDLSCSSVYCLFFFLHFLFVPCGRLSWLSVSFLLHVKYTVSYRIPSLRDVSVTPDCVPYVYALVRQCALASCVTHTLRFIKLS